MACSSSSSSSSRSSRVVHPHTASLSFVVHACLKFLTLATSLDSSSDLWGIMPERKAMCETFRVSLTSLPARRNPTKQCKCFSQSPENPCAVLIQVEDQRVDAALVIVIRIHPVTMSGEMLPLLQGGDPSLKNTKSELSTCQAQTFKDSDAPVNLNPHQLTLLVLRYAEARVHADRLPAGCDDTSGCSNKNCAETPSALRSKAHWLHKIHLKRAAPNTQKNENSRNANLKPMPWKLPGHATPFDARPRHVAMHKVWC